MGTQSEVKVDRRRRQIASSYRKQGYRVIVPVDADAMPPFLQDCHPDVIAEKAGDHVVIEVKACRALKGSDGLVELQAADVEKLCRDLHAQAQIPRTE